MKKLTFLLLLCSGPFAFSQTLDSLQKAFYKETTPLNSDRPGATYNALTVGKGAFLTQWGIEFGGHHLAKWNAESASLMGLLDLRYGVGKNIEIGSFINTYQNNIIFDSIQLEQQYSSYSINLRYTALAADVFRLGFLGDAAYIHDKNVGDAWKYSVKALSSISLNAVFSISSNLGYNYSNGSSWANYTLNIGAALFNDFGMYAETFGDIGNDVNDIWIDAGLWYLALPNLQVDAFFAKGFNSNIQDFTVSLGVSWRLIESQS